MQTIIRQARTLQDSSPLCLFLVLCASSPHAGRQYIAASLAGSLSPVRSPYAELNTRTCANCVNSDTIPALLGSMERIRAVAAVMLSQKMAAAVAVQEDGEAQRDIMSLLVRARLSEARGALKAGAGPVYAMSDTAMMDQVVRA